MPKIREMGFFRSPKFRITCIIRNICNQKREAALLSFCQISGSFCRCYSIRARPFYAVGHITSMFKRSTFACGGCSSALQVMLYKQYRFFCFGDAMLISMAAALCRSMHRWLHNKRVPQSCSHPHCQSAPHPRHSLQSTALPTLPDNPHLPAA